MAQDRCSMLRSRNPCYISLTALQLAHLIHFGPFVLYPSVFHVFRFGNRDLAGLFLVLTISQLEKALEGAQRAEPAPRQLHNGREYEYAHFGCSTDQADGV